MDKKTLLIGCSFTDPQWNYDFLEKTIPWSLRYSEKNGGYIIAKAGMGIKGITTETIYFLESIDYKIDKIIMILPTIFRYDLQVDQETYLCNSMVNVLWADNLEYQIYYPAKRKWLVSGGLNYDKTKEQSIFFDFVYKHQGFFCIAEEHFNSLKKLIDICKKENIQIHISAIKDPMDQLNGLDYIKSDFLNLFNTCNYDSWFKFDGNFIDKFLGHKYHPNNKEHILIAEHIQKKLKL